MAATVRPTQAPQLSMLPLLFGARMITVAKLLLDIVVYVIVGLCLCWMVGAVCHFFGMPPYRILLVLGILLIVGVLTSPLWAGGSWWLALLIAAYMAWKVRKDYRKIKASAERAAAEVAARG